MSQTREVHRLLDDERNRFIQDLVAKAVAPALDAFQKSTVNELQGAGQGLKEGRQVLEKSAVQLASLLGRRLDSIEEVVQSSLLTSVEKRLDALPVDLKTVLDASSKRLDENLNSDLDAVRSSLEQRAERLQEAVLAGQAEGFEGLRGALAASQSSVEERVNASRDELLAQVVTTQTDLKTLCAKQSEGFQNLEELQALGLEGIEKRVGANSDQLTSLQGNLDAARSGLTDEMGRRQQALLSDQSKGFQNLQKALNASQNSVEQSVNASRDQLVDRLDGDLAGLRSEVSETLKAYQSLVLESFEKQTARLGTLEACLETLGGEVAKLQSATSKQHGLSVQKSENLATDLKGQISVQRSELEGRLYQYRLDLRKWLFIGFLSLIVALILTGLIFRG